MSTCTDFCYFLHQESIYVDHERWRYFVVFELLKHDTNDHEVLDVVWPNDEAGWWWILHRSRVDGGQPTGLRCDRTVFDFPIARIQIFVAATSATMKRPSAKRPSQETQVTFPMHY